MYVSLHHILILKVYCVMFMCMYLSPTLGTSTLHTHTHSKQMEKVVAYPIPIICSELSIGYTDGMQLPFSHIHIVCIIYYPYIHIVSIT